MTCVTLLLAISSTHAYALTRRLIFFSFSLFFFFLFFAYFPLDMEPDPAELRPSAFFDGKAILSDKRE